MQWITTSTTTVSTPSSTPTTSVLDEWIKNDSKLLNKVSYLLRVR